MQPPWKKPKLYSGRDLHVNAYTKVEDADKAEADNKYKLQKKLKPLNKDYPLTNNPIKYQQQLRTEYPRLSEFALNIMTILALSTNYKQGFSEAGDLLEKRQSQLQPPIIAALQYSCSWKKIGLKASQDLASK